MDSTKSSAETKITLPENGCFCRVVAGTHKGKEGIASDLNISKTGHITLTITQENGIRFKTLARNVQAAEKTGE